MPLDPLSQLDLNFDDVIDQDEVKMNAFLEGGNYMYGFIDIRKLKRSFIDIA